MGHVYRPQIVRYLGEDGKRVKKGTPGARKVTEKARNYFGKYRDHGGILRQVSLCADKGESKKMLAKLEVDARLKGVGLVDPYAEHRRRPLREHLEDYRQYLLAKDNTEEYVGPTVAKIERILKGCDFEYIGDLKRDAVMTYLATLRKNQPAVEIDQSKESFTAQEVADLLGDITAGRVGQMARRRLVKSEGKGRERRFPREAVATLAARWRLGMGANTANNYIAAIKGFTKWLAEDRTNTDPMRTLKRLNAEVDVRHARRPVTPEDFVRLIEASATGGAFRGLTGEQRVRLYVLAAYTGFRAKELGHLTPAAFNLTQRPATVTVRAKYSKHRRKDQQKLRDDIAEIVRDYSANLTQTDRLWPGTWWSNAAEMLRLDLEAAGIPYEVGEEFFDFHGTRKTFVSWLEQAGVRIKVAQGLARHSTITLTMDVYAHRDEDGEVDALKRLPAVPKLAPNASTGEPQPTV